MSSLGGRIPLRQVTGKQQLMQQSVAALLLAWTSLAPDRLLLLLTLLIKCCQQQQLLMVSMPQNSSSSHCSLRWRLFGPLLLQLVTAVALVLSSSSSSSSGLGGSGSPSKLIQQLADPAAGGLGSSSPGSPGSPGRSKLHGVVLPELLVSSPESVEEVTPALMRLEAEGGLLLDRGELPCSYQGHVVMPALPAELSSGGCLVCWVQMAGVGREGCLLQRARQHWLGQWFAACSFLCTSAAAAACSMSESEVADGFVVDLMAHGITG